MTATDMHDLLRDAKAAIFQHDIWKYGDHQFSHILYCQYCHYSQTHGHGDNCITVRLQSACETEGEGMSTKELIVRLRGLTPHDSEYASLGKEAADKLDEATQYLRECRGLLGNILPAGMSDFIEGFEADTGAEHE